MIFVMRWNIWLAAFCGRVCVFLVGSHRRWLRFVNRISALISFIDVYCVIAYCNRLMHIDRSDQRLGNIYV